MFVKKNHNYQYCGCDKPIFLSVLQLT